MEPADRIELSTY